MAIKIQLINRGITGCDGDMGIDRLPLLQEFEAGLSFCAHRPIQTFSRKALFLEIFENFLCFVQYSTVSQ